MFLFHQIDYLDQIDWILFLAINRINKADLVILRLAIYELNNQLVPYKVAIDEALILAKTFADEDDRKFVNGLLKHFAPTDTPKVD